MEGMKAIDALLFVFISIHVFISDCNRCILSDKHHKTYGNCDVTVTTCGIMESWKWSYTAIAQNSLGESANTPQSTESEDGAIEWSVQALFHTITSCNCDVYNMQHDECTLEINACFNFDTNNAADVSNQHPQYSAKAILMNNAAIYGYYCCDYDKGLAIQNAIADFDTKQICSQNSISTTETLAPTDHPSKAPTHTASKAPSHTPSKAPTNHPSKAPTHTTSKPSTSAPSTAPTYNPSYAPTQNPSTAPTPIPYKVPTHHPSKALTHNPSKEPTIHPTLIPTVVAQTRIMQSINAVSSTKSTIIESTNTLPSSSEQVTKTMYITTNMDNNTKAQNLPYHSTSTTPPKLTIFIAILFVSLTVCICLSMCITQKRCTGDIPQKDHSISLIDSKQQQPLIETVKLCDNERKDEHIKDRKDKPIVIPVNNAVAAISVEAMTEAVNQHYRLLKRKEVILNNVHHRSHECNCNIQQWQSMNSKDIKDIARCQIYNKIHAFHSDLRSSAITKERVHTRYTDSKEVFDFGCKFIYQEDDDDSKQNNHNAFIVRPKFKDLQEELLMNPFVQITTEQYSIEYQKAQVYMKTDEMRELRSIDDKLIPLQCVLAIMIYCNFDLLQHKFSETYRGDMRKDHNNFFHFGKWLSKAVVKFGVAIAKGAVKTFFHGVTENLVPSEIVGRWGRGVSINVPLSATSCWCIAANFAQEGLIMTLGGDWSEAIYFKAFLLSDFPREFEHLFLQNGEHKILLLDIHLSINESLRSTINALKTFDAILDQTNYHMQHTHEYEKLLAMIDHRLQEKECKQNDYEHRMVEVYLRNKTEVTVNYTLLKDKYINLFDKLCIVDYQFINIENVMILWPQVEIIHIKNIDLCDNVMNSIPKIFNDASWLKRIIIETNKQSTLKVYDAINDEQYDNKYRANKVRLRLEGNYKSKLHDILIIE